MGLSTELCTLSIFPPVFCGSLDFIKMVSYNRLNPEDVKFSSGHLSKEASQLLGELPVSLFPFFA